MIAPGAGSQPQKTNWDWSTAGQLVFSGLAVLISLSFALLLAGSALLLQGSQQGGSTEALPMMTMAWSLALVGALVIPSAVLALLRLAGHPLRAWPAGLLKGAHRILPWMILAWLIVLAAGYGISLLTEWNWLLLPPISLLAIVLPVAWLAAVALRGLAPSSPQRSSGIFTTGMVVSPLLSMIIELATLFVMVVAAIIWVTANPQLAQELQMLAQRVANAQDNLPALQRILGSYLGRPGVFIPILMFIAGFTPLVEELIKPLAVWLLARHCLTPAEGFKAGVLSGAGFALVESLGRLGSAAGGDWLSLMISRGGTDLLHIATTGMVGWALACAWREPHYLKLIGTYLLAVALHASWNALGLWVGFDPFIHPNLTGKLPDLAAPAGLVVLALIMFFLLVRSNLKLRDWQKSN
jgi:hypothetical protein